MVRGDADDESLARGRLIAQKKRQLEETAAQVRQDISSCFERLREALERRERQLLRQVEAVHGQQLGLVQSNPALLLPAACSPSLDADLASEPELLSRILDFGRIELPNAVAVGDFEPYRAEEYLEAGEDVVNFDKSLKSEADEFDVSSVMRRRPGNKPVLINFDCASSCVPGASPAVASTSRQLDESTAVGTSSSEPRASVFLENEVDSEDDFSVEADSPTEDEVAEEKTLHIVDSCVEKDTVSVVSSTVDEEKVTRSDSCAPDEKMGDLVSSSVDVVEDKSTHNRNYELQADEGNCVTSSVVKVAASRGEDEDNSNVTSSTIVAGNEENDDNSNVTSSTAVCPAEDEVACRAVVVSKTPDVAKDVGVDEHPIQIQQWLRQILAETETEPIVHEIGQPIVRQFSKIPNTRLYHDFPVET